MRQRESHGDDAGYFRDFPLQTHERVVMPRQSRRSSEWIKGKEAGREIRALINDGIAVEVRRPPIVPATAYDQIEKLTIPKTCLR